MTRSATQYGCPRCGAEVAADALVCGACGGLIHRQRLESLSAEAKRLEAVNPPAAAAVWHECLRLLPADSQQHRAIAGRLGMLSAGVRPAPALTPAGAAGNDALSLSLLKTVGSMAVSVVVYWVFLGWQFAVGLVLSIFVHEMGHVVALGHYKMRASPPIFIPFLGALINLRQAPANAKVEAVVGIGGPVAGTGAAIACFIWYSATHSPLALQLAYFGFFLNLFNMIPMPPLDGGRVTAAISPWFWILGLAALGAMVVNDFREGRDVSILLLITIVALPRVIATIANPKARTGPYYDIGRRASVTMGIAYLLLLALLAVMTWHTGRILHPFGGAF